MDNNEIKVVLPQGAETIKILTGFAESPINRTAVNIHGDIHSVASYIKINEGLIDKGKAYILFSESTRQINLFTDPGSPLGLLVNGTLETYPELDSFKINKSSSQTFSQTQLEKLIRMNRIWFRDKDEHMTLVGKLKSFTAKVQADIQSEQDQRSNKNNKYLKQVTTDLASDFVLSIPIYKGADPSTFRVEICYELTDAQVSFWLESVELYELQKSGVQNAFLKYYDDFKKKDFVVING